MVILIAPCDKCLDCTRSYAFSKRSDSSGNDVLFVEAMGNCTENKNVVRFKKEYAIKYASSCTPGNLNTLFTKLGIHTDLWPSENQITNERAKLKPELNRYSISCLGFFRFILSMPHGQNLKA